MSDPDATVDATLQANQFIDLETSVIHAALVSPNFSLETEVDLASSGDQRRHQSGSTPSSAWGRPRSTPERIGDFKVIEELGSGGFGVVYRAVDERTGEPVALKTLLRMDLDSLSSLKSEFRHLAHVRHPHLARLHELTFADGIWFLAMELVTGDDFISFVTSTGSGLDTARLHMALGQLALAIDACHQAGLLHLDIKPSNILVTREGRLVLLDFGLARHLRPAGRDEREPRAQGTPAFMAPEQVLGGPLDEAADWYAFGGLLYFALSGCLPFAGDDAIPMMARKLSGDPPSLAERGADADPKLARLAEELLQRQPKDRPSGGDVLRRLGLASEEEERPPPPSARFSGRERELQVLADALERARDSLQVVHLRGPSGMGKTSLLARFSEQLEDQRDCTVLGSRCLKSAHVPYRAFDGCVDELAERLLDLPQKVRIELLDQGVLDLLRIFPVLGKVATSAGLSVEVTTTEIPAEARRRAFAALSQLLGRVAGEGRLVLLFDDAQFSDDDSALLLTELLGTPSLRRGCIVLAHRTDLPPGPLVLSARRAFQGRADELLLEPLPVEQAEAVASALLPGAPREDTAALARRAGGVPLLLEELASQARTDASLQAGSDEVRVSELIWARMARLPLSMRAVAEVVALADRPISVALVESALPQDLALPPLGPVVESLRRYHIVKGQGELEPYHDQTRQSIVSQMHPALRLTRHRDLAHALETATELDPSACAHHFREAGQADKAGEYSVRAAEAASRALAFGQAADFLGLAMQDWSSCQVDRLAELELQYAQALSHAGRGTEAGEAFLRAIERSPDQAQQLRRLAAECFLTTGEIDRGTAILAGVLQSRGLRFPRGRVAAIAGLLRHVAKRRLFGTRIAVRPDETIPPAEVEKIELLLGAFRGYTTFSPLLGGYFALVALDRSLRAGYQRGLALTLDYYGVMTSYSGKPADAGRAMATLDAAKKLCERSGEEAYLSRIDLGRGVACTALGDFGQSVTLLGRVRPRLERTVGVAWEMSVLDNTVIQSLIWLGRLQEARPLADLLMRRGVQAGDRFTKLTGQILHAKLLLAAGRPQEARAQVDDVLEQWTTREYTYQHLFIAKVGVWCDLYEGKPAAARARFSGEQAGLRTSGLLGLQLMRAEASFLEGTILLATEGASAKRRLQRIISWLAAAGRPYLSGYAEQLRAGLEQAVGHPELAHQARASAARHYDQAGMKLHAAVCRIRLGDEAARSILLAEGVADPDRWSCVYSPPLPQERPGPATST